VLHSGFEHLFSLTGNR
jgi:hypothetical protein